MELVLKDMRIDVYSRIQRFVYRCLTYNGNKSVDRRRELMDTWGKHLFKDYNWRLTYDESVWPPMDVEYGSKAILVVSSLSDIIHIEIDLNADTHPVFDIVWIQEEKSDAED